MVYPSPSRSSPPNSCLSSPDFAALAEKLKEVAETLLTVAQAIPRERRFAESGEDESADNAESCSAPKDRSYEVRSYQLSKSVLAQEQEILEAYDAENWQEVLHLLRARLETVTLLLKHFDVGEEINGFSLNQIAENLIEPILDMLNKLCSLVVDFDLVYEMKTE